MNYAINSKNRKLKHRLHLILDKLSFNFLNLSWSQKITLIGVILTFFSLFARWFTIEYDKMITNNAFSVNAWYMGYIITIFNAFLLFIMLSDRNKEKLKTKANVFFHDHTITIFVWILILVLCFSSFNSIRWFSKIYWNISVWDWVTFEIIWAFFILVWGILEYREKKNEILNRIYIENSKFEVKADLDEYKEILWNQSWNNKNNMTLPI